MNRSDITSKAPRWWLDKDGRLVYIAPDDACPDIYGARVKIKTVNPIGPCKYTTVNSPCAGNKLHHLAQTLVKTIPSPGDTVIRKDDTDLIECTVVDGPHINRTRISAGVAVPINTIDLDRRILVDIDIDMLTITKFCDKHLYQFIDPRCD